MTCFACGRPLAPAAHYCDGCGAPTGAPTSPRIAEGVAAVTAPVTAPVAVPVTVPELPEYAVSATPAAAAHSPAALTPGGVPAPAVPGYEPVDPGDVVREGPSIPVILGAAAVVAAVAVAAIALFTGHHHGGPAGLPRSLKAADGAIVQSDLRNAATAEETYLTDHAGSYATSAAALRAEGLRVSPGDVVSVRSASPTGYCLEGSDAGGAVTFYYDSSGGGLSSSPCS